jgi:hypothetical protein
MKKGDPDTNGSELNKNNIIKPTLDLLSKEVGQHHYHVGVH